jgi:hypothetical protein
MLGRTARFVRVAVLLAAVVLDVGCGGSALSKAGPPSPGSAGGGGTFSAGDGGNGGRATASGGATASGFNDLAGLGKLLATSEQAQRCHAAKWLGVFTHPDGPSSEVQLPVGEEPSLEQTYAAFAASGFRLRALIAAAATSPAMFP